VQITHFFFWSNCSGNFALFFSEVTVVVTSLL